MINTKELDKYVHDVLLKRYTVSLTEDDFCKVKKLVIQKDNIKGEEISYDFRDLTKFPNLEKLVLEKFFITDELIDNLNLISNLNTLTISHCKLSSNKKLNLNLNTLIINYSDFEDFKDFFENENLKYLELIDIKDINLSDISKFCKLEKLHIYNSNIKKFSEIKNFKNLSEVKLDGTNIDNEEVLSELKGRIKVSKEKTFLLASLH